MEQKHGIEESMDVLEFADALFLKMHEAKDDDGKIGTMEVVSMMISTMPESISAVSGSGDIDDELKELSQEERDLLLKKAMSVVRNAVSLFVNIEKE